MSDFTETITWHEIREGGPMPDSDTTVMVRLDTAVHDEPSWLGYHDGERWITVDGGVASVTAWAYMPEGVRRL